MVLVFNNLRRVVDSVSTTVSTTVKAFGLLSHLIPIILLILYTIFGGWLFVHLEFEADVERIANKSAEFNKTINNEIVDQLYLLLNELKGQSGDRVLERTRDAVYFIADKLGVKYGITESLWDWWMGMFYSGTLYTTIGIFWLGSDEANKLINIR